MDNNNLDTIEKASSHTIKKFQLIEEYVKAWAQVLLNYPECKGIVFIDCMCNSGIYQNDDGNKVFGTPIRVANYISAIMKNYPDKRAILYFSDIESYKIDVLKKNIPNNTTNFTIITKCMDGNKLLKNISQGLNNQNQMSYLLVYDPYKLTIDWNALLPFFQNWGEVILNHMISDPIRGLPKVKRDKSIKKYEEAYLTGIYDLLNCRKDRKALEDRIKNIITSLSGLNQKRYYIASFPFFNSKNSLVYNLIHCSGNVKGFQLFKKTAWKTFGGKSSSKNTYDIEKQLMFDMDDIGQLTTETDEYCYYVKDIAKYLYDTFKGIENVSVSEIRSKLNEHPVFPYDGYANEIKRILKRDYGCKTSTSSITFI